jgi:RNA polymerase sigma factor (sigma-70 family)
MEDVIPAELLDFTKKILRLYKSLNDITLNECRTTYLKASSKWESTRGSQFTTYWYKCVLNVVRAHHKKSRLPLLYCDPHLLRDATHENDEQEERKEYARELISKLPLEYREVAELLWTDGMTKQEVCDYLKLPYSRVRYVEAQAIVFLRTRYGYIGY